MGVRRPGESASLLTHTVLRRVTLDRVLTSRATNRFGVPCRFSVLQLAQ